MAPPVVLTPDELEAIAGGALPSPARLRLTELAGMDRMSSSFLPVPGDALAPALGSSCSARSSAAAPAA